MVVELQAGGRWPEGTDVVCCPRLGDSFSRSGKEVRASVRDGVVKLKGLEESAPYWVGDEDGLVVVAFTAKSKDGAEYIRSSRGMRAHAALLELEQREAQAKLAASEGGLSSAAPGFNTGRRVVEGARSSRPNRQVTDDRPLPKPNQLEYDEDSSVQQRSDTPLGEAHPIPDGDVSPRPSVRDVPADTPMASSTEVGEATPRKQAAPHDRQEDMEDVEQMSATETGEATPVEEVSAVEDAGADKLEAENKPAGVASVTRDDA